MSKVTYTKGNLQPLRKQNLEEILKRLNTEVDTSSMSKNDLINSIVDAQKTDEILHTKVEKESIKSGTFIVDDISEDFHQNDTPEDSQKLGNAISCNDENWTQWVVDQLFENELSDGYPTADGLRRLFNLLIGTIVKSDVTVIEPPSSRRENERATVKYTMNYYVHPNNPLGLPIQFGYEISDAADCYWGNTAKPFCQHPTATATTMAEGRCLRKAMRLRVQTKEEMNMPQGDEAELAEVSLDDSNPASENFKNSIIRISERLHIDITKLLELSDNVNTLSIDTISNREARVLMARLNKYHRGVANGGEAIPPELLIGKDNN